MTFMVVAVRHGYLYYNKHTFMFQEGGRIFMEQTATMKPVTSTFTKKVEQTTYKVNVFFAENPPLQVCRALSGG